ncbi:MAG: hypothetical protein RLZZ579_662 [Actinomycetota bacterium]|jgi:hypothetical protein
MNETFRPRSNFVWAGVALLLLVLFAVNSVVVLNDILQTVFELIFCGILGIAAYVVWIRPKLVLRDDAIEVVNPLTTQVIPYPDVLDLETKWALTIVHKGGKTTVWVAPASGKRRWIAEKSFGWYGSGVPLSESRDAGSESMSASLSSLSGQAAYRIRERMKRLH